MYNNTIFDEIKFNNEILLVLLYKIEFEEIEVE